MHSPLVSLQKKELQKVPMRLQRMLLEVQPYDFIIEHVAGKKMFLADPLSRLNPLPAPPVEGMNVRVCSVWASDTQIDRIRESGSEDPTYNALKDIVQNGWPKYIGDVPQCCLPYWKHRDSISIDNGLLTYGTRLIIPKAERETVLKSIHTGHLGIEKCKRRARDSVYWPGIESQIAQTVIDCVPCQERQKSQPKEPLKPLDIPQKPWQTVSSDLFKFDGRDYLLYACHYSKFPVVRDLPMNTTSGTIVAKSKEIFSEHSIPQNVISDNGPQYDSNEFRAFADEWGFNHITSSPRYPRSNGFIERTVQTVKNIMSKCKASGQDFQLALLIWRTTPIDQLLKSPSELLNKRKYRDNLPRLIQNTDPLAEEIIARLHERQADAKKHHDAHKVKVKNPVVLGQSVWVQNHATGIWQLAKVIAIHRDRDISVLFPSGKVLRRNTHFVRPSNRQCPDIKPKVSVQAPEHPQAWRPLSSSGSAPKNVVLDDPPPTNVMDRDTSSIAPQIVHRQLDTNGRPIISKVQGPAQAPDQIRPPIPKLRLLVKGEGRFVNANAANNGAGGESGVTITRYGRICKPSKIYQA